MAFDPIQEDCLRLVLEAMRRERVPLDSAAFIERSMDVFRENPAKLIHTDRDRSFHLIAKATEIIDYRIPFIPDEAEADRQGERAEAYVREAHELDPGNWDATRMLAALEAESNDAYVSFLIDRKPDIENDLAEALASAADPYAREFMSDLGARPYLRWLAALASRALIAGQYRLAYDTAEESLAFAPTDPADVRHTAILALAKLETPREELKRFHARHTVSYLPALPQRRRHHLDQKEPDAWSLIAEMSAAYREFDFDGADRVLRTLMRSYPRAAQPLFYQAEFPDGVFSRVNVQPGSEDELILALSEATPLFQEGYGTPDNACFSLWLAENEIVQSALDEQLARAQERARSQQGGGEN